MESQIEASNKLIRTLEEKDNMVGINVKNMEQELQLRQQVQRRIFLGGKITFLSFGRYKSHFRHWNCINEDR